MITTTEPGHAEQAVAHAEKAIRHYQRLLAGDGLTYQDKRMFRILLIRAVFDRAKAGQSRGAEVKW